MFYVVAKYYLIKYKTIDEAIEIQNDVPQGLSSSIFSNNMRETELFLSHAGSDLRRPGESLRG